MSDVFEIAARKAGWEIGKFGEAEKWWNPNKDDGSRYVAHGRNALRNLCEDHGIKPFKITILWGEAPEPGDEAKTYEFATEAELNAFKLGVKEMDGWAEWQEVEEGYVVPEDHSNDDDEEDRFTNHYHCDDCDEEWSDDSPCTNDDECPSCGKAHVPYQSDDI